MAEGKQTKRASKRRNEPTREEKQKYLDDFLAKQEEARRTGICAEPVVHPDWFPRFRFRFNTNSTTDSGSTYSTEAASDAAADGATDTATDTATNAATGGAPDASASAAAAAASTESFYPQPDILNSMSASAVSFWARYERRSGPWGDYTPIEYDPTLVPAPASEGALSRLWRPISTFFNGAGATISALGKRKAGNENAEENLDNNPKCASEENPDSNSKYPAKAEVEAAYYRAKELGLLPTPKVFIRPVSRAPKNAEPTSTPGNANSPNTPTAASSVLEPHKDAALHYKTPSKKDEKRQRKLAKRVSDLESKLAATRKELLALSSPNVPPVPPIPTDLPTPPNSHHFFSGSETSPHTHVNVTPQLNSPAKIVKKRKANVDHDGEFKPVTTDADKPLDSERETKRSKSSAPSKMRKPSSRFLKKKPSNITKEEVIIMAPDGENVPPIPAIPKGVFGKKALRNIKRFFGIGKY